MAWVSASHTPATARAALYCTKLLGKLLATSSILAPTRGNGVLHVRQLTHAGMSGTGGKPSLGEEAAVESHDALAAAVNNADMVRLGPDAAAGGSAPLLFLQAAS